MMRSLSELWPRQSSSSRPERTAFVLSGGAAMGALQVGMLRALIERRILPDVILGCSVGAINGAVLAGNPSLATVGRMQDVWMDLIDRELVPTGLLPSPVQLVRRGVSISSNDGMRALLTEIMPAPTFEELDVEFACVATDIDGATERWFTSGDLVSAVLASASIPAVFPAVEIEGVRYLDGAIVDDVPVQRAVDAGATRIFVLQVGGIDRPRPDPKRPIDMAFLAYWIARRHRFLEDLARIPDDVEVVILPHGDPQPVRFDDLSSSAHLMDVAYRACSSHLDGLMEGKIEPSLGPIRDRSLAAGPHRDGVEDDAEMETARRLFAAAKAAIGLGDRRTDDGGGTSPVLRSSDDDPAGEIEVDQETRRSLLERTEAVGPAMRALVTRMLDRSSRSSDEADVDRTSDQVDDPFDVAASPAAGPDDDG